MGARLESERDQTLAANACLCYICAGNVEKLVECWNRIHGTNGAPDAMQVSLLLVVNRIHGTNGAPDAMQVSLLLVVNRIHGTNGAPDAMQVSLLLVVNRIHGTNGAPDAMQVSLLLVVNRIHGTNGAPDAMQVSLLLVVNICCGFCICTVQITFSFIDFRVCDFIRQISICVLHANETFV